jgi:hypothetical protein
MANKLYPNHVLENRFEDQYNSKLDLMQFCTVDNSLVGTAGDTKKINTYTATNGTEVLEMGAGNTKDIEVSYETKEYKIELLQNRFPYFDEEEMNDPLVVEKGLNHMSVDMFNTANAKAMAEFNKATINVPVTAFNFDAFVDGAAMLPFEGEDVSVFALVHKDDVKEIRKNLKDTLQYVEAYARTGYIGTVNGVSIQISNEATAGTIILATKKAVTYFTKKGTEVEQERDANIRKNTVYSRKYGIFAFTDATQAVKLTKGA